MNNKNKETSRMIHTVLKAQAKDKGSYVNVYNTLDIAKFENEKLDFKMLVLKDEINYYKNFFADRQNRRREKKIDNNLIMNELIEDLWDDKLKILDVSYYNNLKNKLFENSDLNYSNEV